MSLPVILRPEADDDNHFVTGRSQVDHRRLHRSSSGRCQEYDLTLGPEKRPATRLEFGQEFEHLRRTVVEQWTIASSTYALGPARYAPSATSSGNSGPT